MTSVACAGASRATGSGTRNTATTKVTTARDSREGAGDYIDTIAPDSNRLTRWEGAGKFRTFNYSAVGNVEHETRSDGERRYTYDPFTRYDVGSSR